MNYQTYYFVFPFTITVKAFCLCWGILFQFFYKYRPMKEQSSMLHSTFHSSHPKNIAKQAGLNIFLFTLPCNLKYWITNIKKIYTFSTQACVCTQFRNSILKYLGLMCTHLLKMLIFFLFLGFSFVCLPFASLGRCIFLLLNTFDIRKLPTKNLCCQLLFIIIHLLNVVILYFLIGGAFRILSIALISFLLGLFLNLTNYIPYLALSFVLSFYSLNDWKSLEEKYFMLKRLIYEACRDITSANNDCTPSRRPKKNEKVLPVVSKELYNKIREELLPYQKTLFYYGIKVLYYSVFSCGIFVLVNIFHEFNFSTAVQVLTTASISIVPHVFNIIGLTRSEESKALNEKLKLNVKYMVDELTVEDPELLRTVLIIQNTDDDMKDDVNEVINEQELKENKQYETSV